MISLTNVTDRPHLYGENQLLLDNATIDLPVARYALLSETPERHAALIDLLAGLRPPRTGHIHHDGLASWSAGRMGFVRGKINGLQMTKFICSIYGIDSVLCFDFLYSILSSPEYLEKSIADWPAYMRREYGFALFLVPEFDILFIDNVMPIENARFGRLWAALFEDKVVGRGLILTNFRTDQMADYCNKALVYEQGQFRVDEDLEGCLRRYPLRQLAGDQVPSEGGDENFDELSPDVGLGL